MERTRNEILPSFLKMLAIATVADAVPLLGENRVIASVGLEQLKRPASPGLRALMQVAKLDPKQRTLTATDLAFRIAPRINAAGRMDVASDVVELFTTRDAARAAELAAKLDRLNGERQQAEAEMLDQIDRRLREEPGFQSSRCIVVEGEGWHRGIIGILASRVVDRMRRPAMVIALEDGEAYGSGRSVPGFHLLHAIESCKQLFTRFGGHSHAVGFSLPASRLPELKSHLEAWAALHVEETAPSLRCHAVLPLDQITQALFTWLRRLEPLGNGNEEPVFVAYNVRLTAPVRPIKERHICLQLAQGARGVSWSALGWDWRHASRPSVWSKAPSSTLPTSCGKTSIPNTVDWNSRSRTWSACKLRACHEVSSSPSKVWMGPEEHPATPPERVAAKQWLGCDGDPSARGHARRRSHSRPVA